MKQLELNGSFVCYDSFTHEKNEELRSFLQSKALKSIIDSIEEKIVIVLGGDGTMLRAIKENYTNNLPFLGLNFGHKGFLLNSKESITPGFNYVERKYPLLEVEVGVNGESRKEIAVNEIDIRAGAGRMIGLDISLSKRQRINIEGDGIIIATPAGSTGYNSSLGGPIIPHTQNAFVMTPKAPWKPKLQSSIIINDHETVGIKNTGRKNPVEIYCDGREFLKVEENSDLDITVKKSSSMVRLIIAESYIDTWDSKVLQEQGFQV
ncbi:MAG: NAD(+)/NADH kinase [Candidatus Gracilibacteria bacterium]|nr:NAD(+)/NADH kinase [Candidatus Gracilibacteria bacterium]